MAGDTTIGQVARAALGSRPPSRPNDQGPYWLIRTVKELGFPVVVTLILLYQQPRAIAKALEEHAALDATRAAELTRAMAQTVATLEVIRQKVEEQSLEIRGQAATVQGAIVGRLKCPPAPTCPTCPPCPAVVVNQAPAVAVPTLNPKVSDPHRTASGGNRP